LKRYWLIHLPPPARGSRIISTYRIIRRVISFGTVSNHSPDTGELPPTTSVGWTTLSFRGGSKRLLFNSLQRAAVGTMRSILAYRYYWEGEDPLKALSPAEETNGVGLAAEVARRLSVPFLALDIG
jgi:hypothetical protein